MTCNIFKAFLISPLLNRTKAVKPPSSTSSLQEDAEINRGDRTRIPDNQMKLCTDICLPLRFYYMLKTLSNMTSIKWGKSKPSAP
jgi:hypothetical protein